MIILVIVAVAWAVLNRLTEDGNAAHRRGGPAGSTLITLVLIPAVYSLFYPERFRAPKPPNAA